MNDEDWGLDLPDNFDTSTTEDALNDPDGPRCFERTCRRCEEPFLVTLYFQSRVGEESPLSVCERCLRAMIAEGKKEVLRRCGPNTGDR